ncbi:hypothetical protein M422DRAFT_260180 [Sphaerobolus stellatus SS14]|uniref:Peptidase A1 domain-containing protein n=1 Tax=Sphaerobolus stellatus (strain SS14) TaxID=990650 RepID=A0A0C9V6P5_SPHS4|nr:hypothetical protein M422DRAFT_260180 [Sphaerobolus stellatus SS14]
MISGATVGGKATSNNTASSSESPAAIDTGTTLIGGSTDGVTAIYSLISAPPAAQRRQMTAPSSASTVYSTWRRGWGANGPNWIIGNTFLKNVYSVFRFDPLAVGFAQLSSSVAGSGTAGPTPPSSGG